MQNQEVEEQERCCPQPEKTTSYLGGSYSHREQILHHYAQDGEADQSYTAISYVQNAKVNETTIIESGDQSREKQSEEEDD